jgi:glycine dehydrogenase subunit 1
VANASMYDGASALAEAALMTIRITKRDEIIISAAVNPQYKEVVKTYANANSLKLKEIDFDDGVTDLNRLKNEINDNTAAVLIQNPNFFGCIEKLEEIEKITHERRALLVVCVAEPTSLGILKAPGDYADIVVGEGQSFGNPLSYGGPYLGFMATKQGYMRQLPGRLVGRTVDADGERGFILTLQAREQHIRREKATSNICSNEALCALAATIYLATLGKNLRKLANINLQKAHYAFNKLKEIGERVFEKPFYNEFIIKCSDVKKINEELLKNKIVGGLELEKYYPQLKNCLLFCVTELNTREEIDKMVEIVKLNQ